MGIEQDQRLRKTYHHCRSCCAACVRWAYGGRPEHAESVETWRRLNRFRRKGRPMGTTWQQWLRKPRVSSKRAREVHDLRSNRWTTVMARLGLLGGRLASMMPESMVKPRWVTRVPISSFFGSVCAPKSWQIESYRTERGLGSVLGGNTESESSR